MPIFPVASIASVRRIVRRFLLTFVALVCGCAPGANLPLIADAKPEPYRLATGDVVRVTTFGEQDLTGNFRVSDSGNIAVPLLGPVRAQGLTVNGLAEEIGKELHDKNLFRNLSVTAEVITYRPVYILGEVAKPGQYPFEPGMTVLTAVSVAGGFTYRAIQDYASVVRVTGDKAEESRAQRQTFIQPGDVITIYERVF
jgi:polysaccharide export outer membrane protein